VVAEFTAQFPRPVVERVLDELGEAGRLPVTYASNLRSLLEGEASRMSEMTRDLRYGHELPADTGEHEPTDIGRQALADIRRRQRERPRREPRRTFRDDLRRREASRTCRSDDEQRE
jgi:hypothetical protein